MSTRLCDWLGHLAVSRPRGVLTLYAIVLLAALPCLLRLDLEADVRNTLPPDMAPALERHNALFGAADLAFLLVQTSPGSNDTPLACGAALTYKTPCKSPAWGHLECIDHPGGVWYTRPLSALRHWSVGLLSLVGISACLWAALCTLPATLHIWGAQRPNGEQG